MVSDLILLRLMIAPVKGESRSRIAASLKPFLKEPLAGEVFEELHGRGLISSPKRQRYLLTESGRTAVVDRFGLPVELPPKTTWKNLRDRYATATALRLSPAKIAEANQLRAAIPER